MIYPGKKVSIQYQVSLKDGTKVNLSEGDTLTYTHGSEDLLPALETALEGLSSGDSTHVVLTPSDAYGPIEDEYFQSVELSLVPEDLRYRGAELSVEDDGGQFYSARLCRINGDEAVLDFNHPLAGQTLVFDINIIEVNDNPYIN